MDGNDGFRRRSMAREGLCARQGQGRGSHGAVSTGKRSLGGFISPWHFCGPQFTGGFHLFLLGICSQLFHNCSRALWPPSHLSHFEDSQWSAPEPLSNPLYTPPQGFTLLCFMRSASHFPSQWWELTSQGSILTPLGENGEQLRWFGGWNKEFLMPLKSPPNSPAILISLSQLWWITRQGECVSSKPSLQT